MADINAEIDGFQITGGVGVGLDVHINQTNTKPIGKQNVKKESTAFQNSPNYKKYSLMEKRFGM